MNFVVDSNKALKFYSYSLILLDDTKLTIVSKYLHDNWVKCKHLTELIEQRKKKEKTRQEKEWNIN